MTARADRVARALRAVSRRSCARRCCRCCATQAASSSPCVLPLLLLFLFGYGVSLDLKNVAVCVVVEQPTPAIARALPRRSSIRASSPRARYATGGNARTISSPGGSRASSPCRPKSAALSERGEAAPIQVLVDGSDPNTAGLVQNYVQGLWSTWLAEERRICPRGAGRHRPAHLVQPGARERGFPAAGPRRRQHDADRHAC